MHIIDFNQNKWIKHISPTLDEASINPLIGSLKTLESWLRNDKHQFRNVTGAGLVTYLNTDNRLKMAMSREVQGNLQERGAKNVLEALYLSGKDSTEKVKECIKKIFEKDMFLNPFNLGTIEYRIGADFSDVSPNPQEAF